MEAAGQPEIPAQSTRDAAAAGRLPPRTTKRLPLRARDVQMYRVCEDLTEGLIYAMVVFGPWAFGTTQSWSVWVMNGAGGLLGLLLAVKLAIRWLKEYRPHRWDEEVQGESRKQKAESRNEESVVSSQWSVVSSPSSPLRPTRLTVVLAVLTMAILVYCLISAVNARATYLRGAAQFAYHDNYLKWLPHSLDSGRTWVAFWTYLGLACSFWAVRDWLLGKSAGEERAERRRCDTGGTGSAPLLPARLRRLLWVLAVNGGLLAVEGIVQRLEGTGNLLFLVKPRVNPGAESQFGPYAYRANASQYFNLLWPVGLGFWWTLNRSHAARRKAHHLVLVCCGLMAACPIISTSRGGALITVGIVILATFLLVATHFLLAAHEQPNRWARILTLICLSLFFSGTLALGFGLGWQALKPRLTQIDEGFELREKMYDVARPMAEDYPWFGTGPGTFESVFQLYRVSLDTYWPAQLHNDWLETRITFGWVGSGLIALALVVVGLRWFVRGGIHGGRRFIILIWLALGGCLVHARFDFPFQIHSIVFLFLLICAMLANLTRRPR